MSAKPPVPTWLLAIGGSAIVFGLATCEFGAQLRGGSVHCTWQGKRYEGITMSSLPRAVSNPVLLCSN